jgi:hypothetical protein
MTNEGKKLADDVHARILRAWNEGHEAGEALGWQQAISTGVKDAVTGIALVVGMLLGFGLGWLIMVPA